MILLKEKIKEYQKKRDTFIKGIQLKFDTFYSEANDDLNILISFMNYTDRLVEEIVNAERIDETVYQQQRVENETINRIINTYTIDSMFNEEKAKKWFVNALVLVVRDDYKFDGCMFTKGNKSLLKGSIIKK